MTTPRQASTDSTPYWKLLKDARWQRKRLEIMQRDNFTCIACGRSDKDEGTTLNVHHAYYEKGKKPWEYDDDMLVTVCSECHEGRHKYINRLLKYSMSFSGKETIGLVRCATYPKLCAALGRVKAMPINTLIHTLEDSASAYDLGIEEGRNEGEVS